MGRPIKISDTLYDRLKDQAEAQGLSLQDALIELLAEPHAAIAGFEKQLDRVRAGASEHLMREKQISLNRPGFHVGRITWMPRLPGQPPVADCTPRGLLVAYAL